MLLLYLSNSRPLKITRNGEAKIFINQHILAEIDQRGSSEETYSLYQQGNCFETENFVQVRFTGMI